MKILAFVRSVPDLSNVRVSRRQEKIFEKGERLLAPISEQVLELAVRLKESSAPSELLALLLGPSEEENLLRKALAFGADRAIHLVLGTPELFDAYGKARLFSEVIRKEAPYDVIVMGESSGMGDGGQTGPRVAEALQLEHLSGVVGLEKQAGAFQIHYLGETGEVSIKQDLKTPVLWVVSSQAHSPRLPSALSIVKAAGKPLKRAPVAETGIDPKDFRCTEILRTHLALT